MPALKDASVVVTGGATGIGYAVAAAMLARGARVAIGSRREDVVRQAVEQLKRTPLLGGSGTAGDAAIGHPLDVADRGSVRAFFDWANTKMAPASILVQAAGVNIKNRTLAEMDPEQWDQVLAVNATGAYNCMYAVLPAMRAAKGGLIVNISSIAGKRAIALGGVAYCAGKFAMTALGTAAGNELAADGVRVTNIYPGEVNTPLLDQRPVAVSDEHKARILQPESVADMVVAIASLPPQAHVPEMVIKPLTQSYF